VDRSFSLPPTARPESIQAELPGSNLRQELFTQFIDTWQQLARCRPAAHDILRNKNNGAANEVEFLGVGLWTDKHKQCRAIWRSNCHPSPNRYLGISDGKESELVHVELKTSLRVRNENDSGVNAKVRRAGHRPDYKAKETLFLALASSLPISGSSATLT
jgi:hypothetical protein